MWLSPKEGTEGDMERLPHWPETIEVKETVWRDYYTGHEMEDFVRPWFDSSNDAKLENDYNCLSLVTGNELEWLEWQCGSYDMSCPCQYHQQPLLRLRGLCWDNTLHSLYTPVQLPGDPTNMLLVGQYTTRIEYDATTRLWTMTDARTNVTATSRASKLSYVLGKHTWTIIKETSPCNPSQEEEYALQEGEWTIDSSNLAP